MSGFNSGTGYYLGAGRGTLPLPGPSQIGQNAPGVTAADPGPDRNAALLAKAFADSVDTGVSITRDITRQNLRAKQEQEFLDAKALQQQEKAAMDAERAQNALDAADRNAASLYASETLPARADDVANGRLVINAANPGPDIEALVVQDSAGQSPVYKEQLRKQYAAVLPGAAVQARRKAIENGENDAARAISGRILAGEDLGDIKTSSAAMGLRPEVVERGAGVAADAAARTGNTPLLNKIIEQSGKFDPDTIAMLRARSAGVEQDRKRAARSVSINRFEQAELDNSSKYVLDRIVDEGLADGSLDAGDALILKAKIENMGKEMAKQTAKIEDANYKNDMIARVGALSRDPNTGGLGIFLSGSNAIAYNPKDPTATMPTNDVRDEVVVREMARFANDQDGGVDRGTAWLATNNVQYSPWKATISGGYQAATAFSQLQGQDRKIGPSTLQGFSLYKRMVQRSPVTAYAHTDGNARAFYEMAAVRQKYTGEPDDKALAYVVLAAQNPQRAPVVPKEVLDTAMSRAGFKNTGNAGEVRVEMERYIQALSVGSGATTDVAAVEAAKTLKTSFTEVDGRMVYVGPHGSMTGRTLPENPQQAADAIKVEWTKRHGNDPGFTKELGRPVKASDLEVATTDEGRWYVRLNGAPAVGKDGYGLFTDTQFAAEFNRLVVQAGPSREELLAKYASETDPVKISARLAELNAELLKYVGPGVDDDSAILGATFGPNPNPRVAQIIDERNRLNSKGDYRRRREAEQASRAMAPTRNLITSMGQTATIAREKP